MRRKGWMIRCSRPALTIFRSGNVEERIINEFNVAAMVQFQIRRAGGAKLAELLGISGSEDLAPTPTADAAVKTGGATEGS